ncbi:hypothetical protein XELAEV_18002089mg [Xenopus laevis]|nr:hypothetical protein XELAEV_18002089mg [Xenopus laevis]
MSPQHSPWLPHSLQHFLLWKAEMLLSTAERQLSAATWACTCRVFACLGDSITYGTLHVRYCKVLSPSLLHP